MAEVPFRFNDATASDEITATTLTDGSFSVTAGAITGATTAAFSGQISANATGNSLVVADTLRIAETGSGLRMTNVGGFDNDGSTNFVVFGTNDLILAANGESGTAITIDAAAQDVAVSNDLSVTGTTTVSTLTDGTLSISGGIISSSTLASPTITGVIALNSNSTTVPPLTLTASSLNDGVGALRIDSVEPDIYLNDTDGGFTTVTFANAGTASAAFGRNSGDDFYITVTADGGSTWRNDTFVVDHDTGNIAVGYKFNVGTGDLQINGTDITATATELNQLDGVTLGTAASANTGDFATAAQGALADTALQIVAVDGVTITGDGTGANPLVAVGGGGGISIGDTITGATQGSVFFAGAAGVLAQDNANLFFDDSNNRLGVGTSSPQVALHIQENSLDEILRIESTDPTPGSNSAPDIIIKSAKQATNDYLGSLWWYANDDGGNPEPYGRIGMILDDPTDSAESGAMFLQSDVEGTLRTMLYLEGYSTGGTGQTTVNYNAKNIDFRVLNDSSVGGYSLYADASTGFVGINENAPQSQLHIVGKDDETPEIRIERSGVSTQYLSLQNEDASGGFVTSHSAESNKKVLALRSVHNSGGSAAGDNLITFLTGAESSPTERMRVSDVDALVTVQSGTDLLVDDSLRVGSTSLTISDYSISAQKSASTVSGGLFSSSIGETAITNDNAGWWLSANGMNTSSKYTPALKFGSTDDAFTTDNPKWLAGIIGRATETYSGDTDGGMALDFLTFPINGGADGGPTVQMTIDGDGEVGIGTTSPAAELHIVASVNPELRLQESGQNGYTTLTGLADNYGSLRVNNDNGTESTILDIEADSNGTGAQTIRLFRLASATATSTKLQILSPGTTTETFAVDASTGNIDTSGTVTQSVSSAVLVANGSGVISAASTLQDVAYQEQGISVPQLGTPPGALPGSIDPMFPMDPFGWVQFDLGGQVVYVPAYTFSPP